MSQQLISCDMQWCIAKNGGGYTQRGVAKGLKVPCLFIIAEVSIRCTKNPGGWYTPYTRVYPPIHHWWYPYGVVVKWHKYVPCNHCFFIIYNFMLESNTNFSDKGKYVVRFLCYWWMFAFVLDLDTQYQAKWFAGLVTCCSVEWDPILHSIIS